MRKRQEEVAFYESLFRGRLSERTDLVKALIEAARTTGYSQPLEVLLELKETELRAEKQRIGDLPIKAEGEWLTVEQIARLNLGHNSTSIQQLINSGNFQAKKRDALLGGESEYWVDSSNIARLERPDISTRILSRDLQILSEARVEVEALRKTLEEMGKAPKQVKETEKPQPIAPTEKIPEIGSKETLEGIEGIWMAAPGIIAAGSPRNSTYLGQILRNNPDQYRTVKGRGLPGNPNIGFITRENYKRLGLPRFPGDPIDDGKPDTKRVEPPDKKPVPPTQPTPYVEMRIGGKDERFDPKLTYDSSYVVQLLRIVHSEVFSDGTTRKALEYMRAREGKVTGSSLIDFLKKVNGMLILGSRSTEIKLEQATHVDFGEFAPLIRTHHLEGYLHRFQEVLGDKAYFLAEELPNLAMQLALVRGKAPPTTDRVVREIKRSAWDILQEYRREELRPRNIDALDTQMQNRLIESGIWDLSTPETAERSLKRYRTVMENWETFDLSEVARRLRLDMSTFLRMHADNLRAKRLIKNITDQVGLRNKRNFYVLAAGKRKELYAVVGLPIEEETAQ